MTGLMSSVSQVVWSGLIILGFQYLFIALRRRERLFFMLLGTSLILLGLLVGIDILFLTPALRNQTGHVPYLEAMICAMQILACGYVGTALWFARLLTGRPSQAAVFRNGLVLAALSSTFAADAVLPQRLMIGLDGMKWIPTVAYDWIYTPYLIGLFAYVVFLTFRGYRRARLPERRILGYLCASYALLFAGAMADFIILWAGPAGLESNIHYGAMGMGVMGVYLFTDRLVSLYTEQRKSLLEIAGILGAMEIEKPLGEIGKSAAHMSVEILDYVSSLKRDSDRLLAGPASGSREEFLRIDGARRKLERYTTGILDISTSSRLGPRSECDAASLLRECVPRRFPGLAERIRVTVRAGSGSHPNTRVLADPAKLEKAFAELIKNALESDSALVDVRIEAGRDQLSVAIADRGIGCPEGSAERIAQPFFTTRKAQGACGLGASIAAAVLKAHGGGLTFRPGEGGIGLTATAVLPLYPVPKEKGEPRSSPSPS